MSMLYEKKLIFTVNGPYKKKTGLCLNMNNEYSAWVINSKRWEKIYANVIELAFTI